MPSSIAWNVYRPGPKIQSFCPSLCALFVCLFFFKWHLCSSFLGFFRVLVCFLDDFLTFGGLPIPCTSRDDVKCFLGFFLADPCFEILNL